MIEKVVTLENISLIDFLGVEDRNIHSLASAFPKSRIVSRGNKILIRGSTAEVVQIDDILNALINHYHKYGQVREEDVHNYLSVEKQVLHTDNSPADEEVIVYGTKGLPVKPKTPNQVRLVQLVKDNDLVFALGPAGTGKTYISVAFAVKALKSKQVKKSSSQGRL